MTDTADVVRVSWDRTHADFVGNPLNPRDAAWRVFEVVDEAGRPGGFIAISFDVRSLDDDPDLATS